jgi:3-oxoacyl-[acyl-carrier-protein] synthase II
MTSNTEQRIVVTGLGATTPVGGSVTETWEAVLAGE